MAEPALPITFRDYVAEHGNSSVWGTCSEKTKKNYASLVAFMLTRFFGDLLMMDIVDIRITDFKGWCGQPFDASGNPKTVYGPYSINNALRRLREVLRNALARETIKKVPKIELLDEPELRLELSPEERETFLAAFDDRDGFLRLLSRTRWNGSQTDLVEVKPWHAGVVFGDKRFGRNPNTKDARHQFESFQASKVWFVAGLNTGLRKSDLLALSRRSVKFKDSLVTVTTGKTGRTVTLPLSAELEAELKGSMLRAKAPVGTDDAIIITPSGVAYNESSLKRYFKVAKRLAGITRRFRFHDMRHTFGSDLGSAGYGEHVIMELMGHTTTEMTRRYVHPHASILASVKKSLDEQNRTKRPDRSVENRS